MNIQNLSFVSARYIPGEACLEQGFKGGSVPTGRYYGSNGSFVTISSPKYILTFRDNVTGKEFEKNCYFEIKRILFEVNVPRLTKKYRELIEEMLKTNEFPVHLLNLDNN